MPAWTWRNRRVPFAPDQRAVQRHAMLFCRVPIITGRRNAQRVGDEPDGVTECDLEELFAVRRHRRASRATASPLD